MDSILIEIKDKIAFLKLNRPDKLNSFNTEMAKKLQSYLDDCNSNPEVNCIVITGEGKAFCAGQDLQEAIGDNAPSIDSIVRNTYNPIIQKIQNNDKPVIAMVNGVAAGAGANIAFACDIVIASENSSFIQAFSKIGLIPDSGGTFFLPRLVGAKAMALMLTGDKLPASEAERINLIYKSVPQEQLLNATLEIANKITAMSPTAMKLTKKLVQATWSNSLDEQLLMEEQYQKMAGDSPEYIAGVNAFLNKSK